MPEIHPPAVLTLNEKTAKCIVGCLSAVVLIAVLLLNRVQVSAPDGLDVHIFAKFNAGLNSIVTLLLVSGLIAARVRRWVLHRAIMLTAIVLSSAFLVSYILHHLFAGDTHYGGQGAMRWIYYLVLITHIILAAGSLPFILWTAYRALSGGFPEHQRLAKLVWPVWLYVSASGVIVYWLISPYY